MRFPFGCHHPSFAPPWRSLLPYLVALHLLRPGSAQLRVVAPSLRVTAVVGQDVVLRCHLSPCKDAWSSDIRWIQHPSSGFVHHYQNGVDLEQMEEYKGRTKLLRSGLSDGNLDLRIKAVSSSDSGSYSCAVEDGDGYAEAVVELEVSDPFSEIIHPWKVALALVITLVVGSFVTIGFLYRKRASQSRELKRKDAELAEHAAALERKDAELAEQAATLERKDAELERKDAALERKDAELAQSAAILNSTVGNLNEKAAKLSRIAAVLKELAAKVEKHRTWTFGRNYTLEELATGLQFQIEALVEEAEALEKPYSQLKERCEEMGEKTAALVVETKDLGKPSTESD